MRDLKRNQQKIYYALYQSNVPIYETDENGDVIYIEINGEKIPVETGATTSGHSSPVEYRISVSPSKGEASENAFGKSLDYDKALSTHDMRCSIDEFSHLWIDTMPVLKEDGSTDTEHDYEVKKVAKSLNNILYAVKRKY